MNKSESGIDQEGSTARTEAPASSQTCAWPSEFSAEERELIRAALAFLAAHHGSERERFGKDADDPRFATERRACLQIWAHHTEQLHDIGELLAKCGMRNGWPRP